MKIQIFIYRENTIFIKNTAVYIGNFIDNYRPKTVNSGMRIPCKV